MNCLEFLCSVNRNTGQCFGSREVWRCARGLGGRFPGRDGARRPARRCSPHRSAAAHWDVLLARLSGWTFGALLLTQPVLEGLREAGFERPSPIQLKAIPLGRCGLDLIVQAKSGTGKTCVFSTIALDSLILDNPATQILVLAPTREIAVQIHSVITAIGIKMEGLECHVFIGGTPLSLDKVRLKKCHIAVGSPGRIKQLIEIGFLPTASIRLFVLDEADKLLEEGSFQEQINWIYSSLPSNKQMLALSATYPESLAKHLMRYMRDPSFVRLNPTDPALIGLKQFYKVVNFYPLPHKIFEEKVQHLLELFSKIPFNQALVFSNLHSRAQRLADILTSRGLPAVCISGSMNQNQRLEAMSKLKQFKCRVLISTDLTSRGIDAEKVNLVVNLDIPQDWETYMHRIGRAGRFGTQGIAVTYCCRGEEENELGLIAQRCNLQLLPLPDPIPSGLLEEPVDWDINVMKVQEAENSSLATTPPPLEVESSLTAKQQATDPELLSLSTAELAGKKPTNRKVQKSRKIPIEKDHQCLLGGDRRTPEVGGGYVPDKDIKMKVQSNLRDALFCDGLQSLTKEPSITLQEKKVLQESLPKILPLTLFKKRQKREKRLLNFLEIVKDYENFLTERNENPVEIVRQWMGFPGVLKEKSLNESEDLGAPELISTEQMSREQNSKLFLSKRDMVSLHTSQKWTEPSGLDSQEPSDSNSSTSPSTRSRTSSSESSTETEVPVVAQVSQEDLLMEDQSPMTLDSLHPNPKSFPDGAHSDSSSNLSSKRQLESDKGSGRKNTCPGGWSPKGDMKRSKGDPKFGSTRTAKVSSVTEASTKDASFPYSESGHLWSADSEISHDYWKAYYHAWRSYYAAIGYPYYGSSERNSEWLKAYQMNSVYLKELFKP
ncbi:probable ATP-dependent RNA helicase DDX20 [Pristis pectinata]|uniref:probable ATP-dependent RNA helicase DDX20 n=1 Tax=Pristis pectinata TaxID=685728 RepID=UPI00223D0CC4|nr:probable ATP-dependent RNA helicase DDX20 [Pristis pectinata]